MEFTRTTGKTAIQAKNHIEHPYITLLRANVTNTQSIEKPKTKRKRQLLENPTTTIVNKFADDVPLSSAEVAAAMRMSRWTLYRYKHENGYVFEFGRKTTLGHLKNWLRQRALKKSGTDKEVERQNA